MKQRYIDYADYNIWANNRLIDYLLKQDAVILAQEMKGSFLNIQETIKHIWFAEMGWLARLQGSDWNTKKIDSFQGSAEELFAEWQITSKEFRDFLNIIDLENKVNFVSKGRQFLIPSREIVQTVFNHGTYHRGQVVTILRQLDVTDIPQTDYIEWVRQTY